MLFKKEHSRRYKTLSKLITKHRCRKILEIGTWKGTRANQMIDAAKKNFEANDVEYYGFDLFELMTSELCEKEFSKSPPALSEVHSSLEKTGAQINLFQGNTLDTLPDAINKLPKIDFIFIDGGHSLETISSDWKYCKQLMHEKTIVVFDDYYPADESKGCKNLIETLDCEKFDVSILPPRDKFKKPDGVLEINLVKVEEKLSLRT